MQLPERKDKGFTLVELLIVVAILGILAAIAIPQYTKYKKNATITGVESALKTCSNDIMAQFAAGELEAGDDITCSLPDDASVILSIDNTENVSYGSLADLSVGGYTIDCTYENNRIRCAEDGDL